MGGFFVSRELVPNGLGDCATFNASHRSARHNPKFPTLAPTGERRAKFAERYAPLHQHESAPRTSFRLFLRRFATLETVIVLLQMEARYKDLGRWYLFRVPSPGCVQTTRCRMKNPYKLSLRPRTRLRSPLSSPCLKGRAYRTSRGVRTSTTRFGEHFVGRYSVRMAGQWLFSFPPAWRKKRGCFCKKGSCPTKGCDEKANWNQRIPENINGNVTGRCALRSSCRRTRQANALTEPQSRECAK